MILAREATVSDAMQTATIFNHETIALDGETFSDCEFRTCRLVYSGGKVPSFSDCRFDGCDAVQCFVAAHGRTVTAGTSSKRWPRGLSRRVCLKRWRGAGFSCPSF